MPESPLLGSRVFGGSHTKLVTLFPFSREESSIVLQSRDFSKHGGVRSIHPLSLLTNLVAFLHLLSFYWRENTELCLKSRGLQKRNAAGDKTE